MATDLESPRRRRTCDELLVRRKRITPEQQARARNYAERVGIDLHLALIQLKAAPAEAVMQALAEAEGVLFHPLDRFELDLELLDQFPILLARNHSVFPLKIRQGRFLVAAARLLPPDLEEELRLRTGHLVQVVLSTPGAVHRLIEKYFPLHRLRSAAPDEVATAPPAGLAGALSLGPLNPRHQKALLVVAAAGIWAVAQAFIAPSLIAIPLTVALITVIAMRQS